MSAISAHVDSSESKSVLEYLNPLREFLGYVRKYFSFLSPLLPERSFSSVVLTSQKSASATTRHLKRSAQNSGIQASNRKFISSPGRATCSFEVSDDAGDLSGPGDHVVGGTTCLRWVRWRPQNSPVSLDEWTPDGTDVDFRWWSQACVSQLSGKDENEKKNLNHVARRTSLECESGRTGWNVCQVGE